MLKGHRVCLRPVREADLDSAYDAHLNLESRGEFFPQGVLSESAFKREFAEHGFWQQSEGMLLIKTADRLTFAQNKRTLCVSCYDPGNVFAVTGPWRKR